MADGRHLEKSKNVVLMNIINSLLKTGNKTVNINVKTAVYTHCVRTFSQGFLYRSGGKCRNVELLLRNGIDR